MSDVSRRHFLKLGACVVGGACAADALPPYASRREWRTHHAEDHPSVSSAELASLGQLEIGREQLTTYPDHASPVMLPETRGDRS